ncbi:hypothetical protein V5O48_004065 [Marasmius crinis-equi]|uniref:Chitinase n=1 Tax=Marasmius crinis-equi TaxID=585013 RepID=A0ABR3FR48_9AGAR
MSAPSQVLCGTPCVAQAWYCGWHKNEFTPANVNVSWNKYTQMTYVFQAPNFGVPSSDLKTLNMLGPDVFPGKRMWILDLYTGQTPTLQQIIQSSNKLSPNLPLVGISWMGLILTTNTPPVKAFSCNTINANDTANFIPFLEELHKDLIGKNLILTTVIPITPCNNTSGNPSTNLSHFVNALNYITLMDYEIWGPWVSPPLVGPNASLDDLCADKANQ